MASWLATGPPGIVCDPPLRVVIVVSPLKFWTTPLSSSTMPKTIARGSRTRSVMRVRSTQKLPEPVGVPACQPSHERHRHGDADGSR